MRLASVRHALSTTLACGLMLVLSGCGNVDDGFQQGRALEDLGSTHQGISLGSALGSPVYSGGTCGLVNGVTPGCATSTASDMSFEWIAPSSGTFTFSTVGSGFDTVLVIADYYTPSSVLACAGSVAGTGGETVSLNLTSGQRLLVTVDGYASLCGSFQLNITKPCTFGGTTYQDGQTLRSSCTSKNGYCIGGVYAGDSCVSSLDCYATCYNGTWEHY